MRGEKVRNRRRGERLVATVATLVVVTAAAVPAQDYRAPRTSDGEPDLGGIWQALGSAHWDIEGHAARMGPIVELGALGATPGGLGIVEGGEIPYTAAARAKQQENLTQWWKLDPAIKCFMPGIPRANYMPFPFQIVQTPENVIFAYEFASASRIVYMNRPDFESPGDNWMGHSRGHWEGETLVIDVSAQVPDTWLDSSGNHHSEEIHVLERYSALGPDHLLYEATITDPKTYTRPWKVSFPLYRRIDENMQLLDFKCVVFAEELMYSHLSKGVWKGGDSE